MSFRNPFAPRRPGGASGRVGLVKDWVRAAIGFGDAVTVAVSQIACRHSTCGGAETLVMIDVSNADLRVLRFAKPLADVTEDDVRAAIDAALRQQPAWQQPARKVS
ncbi:Putative nitrate reductase, delta subunit (modular protein) [uncultured Pleomorphomonas sp.]|uniref:Putative nitrate reductase, delta subunit (Modular protein) n=1 Tax=uncultured Pleomorphomonas sp. TaxID=442121 RepID=A0A212L2I1_9HYPH|nr:nitrate reductase [uncultured Pleomorphomonas sp.]SCM71762.1 Putative nitrate reductase, delta subunit (modular protein) [uncultured Pleomorphomonas sp.]